MRAGNRCDLAISLTDRMTGGMATGHYLGICAGGGIVERQYAFSEQYAKGKFRPQQLDRDYAFQQARGRCRLESPPR